MSSHQYMRHRALQHGDYCDVISQPCLVLQAKVIVASTTESFLVLIF